MAQLISVDFNDQTYQDHLNLTRTAGEILEMINAKSIKEIHILPKYESVNENRPKVLYVDGNLGLSTSVMKILHGSYYHKLLSSCNQHVDKQTLTLALICNPYVSTLWNRRKELIMTEKISVDEEEYFSKLALNMHPKCSAIFEHRRWLLTTQKPLTTERIKEEIDLCISTASKYSHNYYSWSHRVFCLSLIPATDMQHVLADELKAVRKWREHHISEYGAFSYCQYLISKLTTRSAELYKEYYDTLDLLSYYPHHDSLWSHRKWIILNMALYLNGKFQEVIENELSLTLTEGYFERRYIKGLKILLERNGIKSFCGETE